MICRLDLMHLQLEILFSLMTYRRTGVQTGLLEFTDPEVSFVRFFSLSFGWPGCNFVMMPRPSLLIWWLWCRSEHLWLLSLSLSLSWALCAHCLCLRDPYLDLPTKFRNKKKGKKKPFPHSSEIFDGGVTNLSSSIQTTPLYLCFMFRLVII